MGMTVQKWSEDRDTCYRVRLTNQRAFERVKGTSKVHPCVANLHRAESDVDTSDPARKTPNLNPIHLRKLVASHANDHLFHLAIVSD